MKKLTLILTLAGLTASCGPRYNNLQEGPERDTGTQPDSGMNVNAGTGDMGGADVGSKGPDIGGSTDGGAPDMDLSETLEESEPNGGASLDEVNDLPLDVRLHGTIDTSDSDVFFVPATPGARYRVALDLDAGSQLQPHITVLDAGRGTDPPGDDYVKIVRGGQIDFFGMGSGGYFVAVRDSRNVDGDVMGGADFGYTLVVTTGFPGATDFMPLDFGTTLSGTLDGPGGVDLYSFDGTEGTDVRFDFAASGDLDGRLFVYAESEGSWIARQDDRSFGDPNPLLDAPLFANGAMYLVVESIAEEAMSLGYTIDASLP